MAGRGHVDVNERRLRPVYDCLDNGNNKKALQEADKVLKKQKDLLCAKVLKSLALLRLGRQDESSALIAEVHALHPTDDATLQAMAICYREVHKLELIADMYENAHKAKPDNEEVLSALFMSYVRLGNYKKQQQTAMSLHRLRPNKNPYYFWAIMSIVMQAHTADEKLAQSMFLPLAERMTLKYVNDNKIEAEAEIQMYLMILELMGKNEEALKVVQGPLGEKLTSEPNFQAVKAAELSANLERWAEVNAAYRKMLLNNPDQWKFYVEYFRSLFSLMDMGWTPEQDNSNMEDLVDNTVEKAGTFVLGQQEHVTENSHKIRGPFLAQLELLKQVRARKDAEAEKLGDPAEMLKQYYDMFGDKFACFTDLRPYLELLEQSQLEQLIAKIDEELGMEKKDGDIIHANDAKIMQRHLFQLQLSRYAGHHSQLSCEERCDLVKRLSQRYLCSLKFGENLLPTDFQFCDDYILMAVHIIHDLWIEQAEDKHVWQMILLLERGLKNSPSNFQFKLILIKLYVSLGAFGPCAALYESLEIKHVQHDTLGYAISNHVGRLGHFSSACSIYGGMLKFFTVNHKDTTEYLISSYKFGSFSTIYEFVKFRERLQNSLQYAIATAERLLLDLTLETNSHQGTEQMMSYMEIDPEKDKTIWGDLRDNRDFGVLSSWDPTDRLFTEELKEKSFKEEVAWLKARNLVLRALAASIILGRNAGGSHQNNSVGNGESKVSSMADTLQNLIKQLKSHLTECQNTYSSYLQQYPLAGPYRTRLSTYLNGNYSHVLCNMLQLVLYIHSLQEEGLESQDEAKGKSLVNNVTSDFTELLEMNKGSLISTGGDDRQFHPEVLENMVLTAEALCQVSVLMGVCHRHLKPMKQALVKKSKKKKESAPVLPATFAQYADLVAGLEKGAHDLHTAVQQLDQVLLTLTFDSLKISDDMTSDILSDDLQEKDIWQKVEASYQQSAKELTDLINNKLKYLASLKL